MANPPEILICHPEAGVFCLPKDPGEPREHRVLCDA
jgi:hypothetical protein